MLKQKNNFVLSNCNELAQQPSDQCMIRDIRLWPMIFILKCQRNEQLNESKNITVKFNALLTQSSSGHSYHHMTHSLTHKPVKTIKSSH